MDIADREATDGKRGRWLSVAHGEVCGDRVDGGNHGQGDERRCREEEPKPWDFGHSRKSQDESPAWTPQPLGADCAVREDDSAHAPALVV